MPMNQMQEYFVHEFVHDYQAGYLSRRDMIRRVLYITGGAATTASLLLAARPRHRRREARGVR